MATTEQKFLDYPGLEYYHQQNIATMDEKDVSVLDNSKSYTDSSVQAKGNELGTRIDNLILNAGDSSAECADARVTKDGTVHDTLKNRLDTEYSQLSSENAELKGDLANYADKSFYFNLTKFTNGRLDADKSGYLVTDTPRRVSTVGYIVFPFDVTLYVANGFKFSLLITDANDFLIENSGWLYYKWIIPKNTKFRVQIARLNENQSETADIDEFVSKIVCKITNFDTENENRINYFNKDNLTVGRMYVTQGKSIQDIVTAISYASASNIIEIKPNDIVHAIIPDCLSKDDNVFCFAFYDKKGLFVTRVPQVVGQTEYIITVPSECYYMRVTCYNQTNINDTQIAINRLASRTGHFYEEKYNNIIPSYEYGDLSQQWSGKIACCYGSSIMARGGWTDYIKQWFNFAKFYNRGIGGSMVSTHTLATTNIYTNTSQYDETNSSFLAGSTSGDGTKLIQTHYWNPERIETLPVDADLIFVDVCTNDFYEHADIGSYVLKSPYNISQTGDIDYDGTTISGGMGLTIKAIMNRCPKAKIVFLGMPYNNTIQELYPQSDGKLMGTYFYQCYDACKKVAREHGCEFIPMVELMGINMYNLNSYMTDGIHPQTTDKGTRAYAYSVASYLKNIMPKQI